MCDDITELENQGFYEKHLNRRDFNLMAGGAAISLAFAGCTPGEMVEGTVEADVMIETPDGMADAYFAHPEGEASTAVLIWPDIVGLRPAFKMMAKRLAGDGYAALVVNPYYRQVRAPLVEVGQTFKDPAVREKIVPYARALSQETNRTDARAFVKWLDTQSVVDKTKKMGTTGYCMGGPMTMITAAELPERIGAGASFHGGGLVTEAEDSPHLLIPQMNAQYLIAIAENDDERDPVAKETLKDAFADANLAAEIEVYEGTQHGWCPPDSAVYDEAKADKAWARKLALFERALS
jgi:carboxymethylenebutenolidase